MKKTLKMIRKGQYEMPKIDHMFQDLLSKILVVDPKNRISITGIKNHPVFKLFLPQEYIPPSPLPLLSIDEPIPQSMINQDVVSQLEKIGFRNHHELMRMLMSRESNMAKVFYRMLFQRPDFSEIP